VDFVSDVVRGEDGVRRCRWGASTPEYCAYHDAEWGRPVTDDTALYEKLCLEGFQSGLSWITILRKRENFRKAFKGFDHTKVARFTTKDVNRLMNDAGIVRNRAKIEATIANARAMQTVIAEHGSLAALCWEFRTPARQKAPRDFGDIQSKTDASIALSKRLLKLGFRFVGPTTVYAMMQATGIVNDHMVGCHARAACEQERKRVSSRLPSRSR
jgi:DNA-3-methyladenine glycosylase I